MKENPGLLTAYRQIKNETNIPLKYLMCYRLLEVLAKRYSSDKDIDKMIKREKIDTPFIKNKRGERVSLIKHFRQKIHATNKKFSFPYSVLHHGYTEIEKVTRKIISKHLEE